MFTPRSNLNRLLLVLASSLMIWCSQGLTQNGSGTRQAISATDCAVAKAETITTSRRKVFGIASALVVSSWTSKPEDAHARFVLDDETGEFVEVEEGDWQSAWKQRLDKASSMSKDEIFQAARGAGNTDLRQGPESDASKKRRAMSACRDSDVRAKAQAGSEKECTARVFAGEVDFLLEKL